MNGRRTNPLEIKWTKIMNRFTPEEKLSSIKMKRYSISTVIRTTVKTIMTCHFLPIRLANNVKYWRGCGEKNLHTLVAGM